MSAADRHLELGAPLLERQAGRAAWDAAATALHAFYAELADPEPLEAQREQRKSRLLGCGMAISPHLAGRCLLDGARTARYLQAVDAAVEAALQRRDEPLHLLYAGCGPYAPLALAVAARHPAARLRLTLLDAHPEAIASVARLARRLGLEGHIEALECCDATTYRVAPERRPHVVVSETMLRALTTEPQVAITLNLAPQMAPDGVLIPRRIVVGAALADPVREFDGSARPSPSRLPLGELFVLERETATLPRDDGHLPAATLTLPAGSRADHALLHTTVIELLDDLALEEYDSGLTEPMVFPLAAAPRPGERIRFAYRLGERPELVQIPA